MKMTEIQKIRHNEVNEIISALDHDIYKKLCTAWKMYEQFGRIEFFRALIEHFKINLSIDDWALWYYN